MHSSRRFYLRSAIFMCLLLLIPRTICPAQNSPQAPPQVLPQRTVPMLDEGKGLIHLDVSVTKGDGESVYGLHGGDFELLDQGRPQRVLSFHAFNGQSSGPEPSVQVILFFDTLCKIYPSCMSKANALRAQAGIETFLRQKDGHLDQPVSIFGISDDGLWTIPHHHTIDGNSLASELSSGKRIELNSRPDALRALAFIATSLRRVRGRKVMLWIGPGCGRGTGIFPPHYDEGQKTFYLSYWFSTLFRQARLSIDEIPVDQEGPCAPGFDADLNGPKTVHEANGGFLYKKVLAIQSGGRIADGTNDLVAEINHCLMSAPNFYTLSVDPPIASQPHEYHSLQVIVDRPGLVARTDTDYYDEPYYSDQGNPAAQREKGTQLEQLLTAAESSEGGVNGDSKPPEIQKQDSPDLAEQDRLLALTKNYLNKVVRTLPDFTAIRTTVRYEDTPLFNADKMTVDYQPLRVVEKSKAKVIYRDGKEVVESQDFEPNESSTNFYLITHGTFGTLLAEVRQAMETPGRLQWVRWERGPEGNRAVFGFEVPQADSKNFEGGCCLPDEQGDGPFRRQSGYRDEVTINPSDGTIVRLLVKFDMHEYVPMDRDEIVIDYGPVKIGGKTYLCPTRSLSLARGRSIVSLKEWDQSFLTYGPYSTKVNDMRFSSYHVSRAEARLLPGFKSEQR
jgi:VWFA-related protein